MIAPRATSSKRPQVDEPVACPECKSTHLVRDEQRGEVVCDGCGLVISDSAIDPGPEWSAFSVEEHDRLSRTGAPRGYTSQSISLTTVIPFAAKDSKGNPIPVREREKYFRMRKLQRHSDHSRPGERSLPETMVVLDRVASSLGLPKALEEQGGFLCKKALEKGLLRGRKIAAIVAAAVYASCRMGGVPRTLEELQQATGVRKKEIGKSYHVLLRELGLRVPPSKPADYVSRFCSELGLGTDVQRQTYKILKEIEASDRSLALSPVGTSAAAIYLASLACGKRRPQKLVAKVAGVSEVTLRNRFRYVSDLSRLLLAAPRTRATPPPPR
ncbi:MAG: transcription initiation factor IIB [Euryarchaeota archaeon]|nr:transcription initiation factor IIB [Euryarchaeota archaeon]